MTRYLLDTNHASSLYKNEPRLPPRITAHSADQFLLCYPSVAELWYMVHNGVRIGSNETRLRYFLTGYTVLALDAAAVEEFGKVKADLRRRGRPIPDVDVQIAAIAIANDLTLLTDDAHFGAVGGLRVENWLR